MSEHIQWPECQPTQRRVAPVYIPPPKDPPAPPNPEPTPADIPSGTEAAASGGAALPTQQEPSEPQEHTYFDFSLPSEGFPPQSDTKVKKLLTSVSATRSQEIEDLRHRRMLELARASRETFAAYLKYRRLRERELEIMRTIAADEREEAEALLRDAERQIGEIRHHLCSEGKGHILCDNAGIKLFPDVGAVSCSSLSSGDHDGEEMDWNSPIPSENDEEADA